MKTKITKWTNSNIVPHDEKAWLDFVQEACTDKKHSQCLDLGACRDAIVKGGEPGHCRVCLGRCSCVEINIEIDKKEG